MATNIGPKIGIDGEAEYRKQLQGIITETKTLGTEMKKLQSSFDGDKRSLKQNRAERELLTKQVEKQKEAVQHMSEMLDKAKTATGESSQQTQKWQQALNKAETDLNNLQKQLDSLPNSIQLVGSKMSEAGQKIKGVGDSVKGFGEGMTKKVTAPIVGIGAAAIAAFNEVDAGLDTIITKTGASGEALDSMQKSMEDLATSIPTSFEDAGTAVGEVNTRFGVMGDDLTELSGQFIKFAQLNGTDVSGSIDKVQSSMAAFGIETKDAGYVLDILNKAGQDTGVSLDTLSSTMTANSTVLQEMGFDFNQSAGFIANLSKNGIDASAVMAGLKKALANATKEGKPLDQALAELQESLTNAKDDTEAMQLATELFGSKAGPQLAAALQEGRISLDETANSITGWGNSVSTTFDATLDAPDKLKVTLNELKIVGADLGGTLLEMLVPALEKLSEVVKSARDAWNGLDDGQKKTIITIGGAVAVIGPLLVALGSVIGAIGTIVTTVGGAITAVGGLAAAFTAAGGVAGILSTAGGVLAGVFAALVSPIGLAIAAVAAITAAGILLYQNWDTVKAKAAELADAAKQKWEEIKTNITNAVNNAKQAVEEKFGAIKTKIEQVAKDVKTAIGDLPGKALKWGKDLIQNFVDGIKQKWDNLKSTVTGVAQGISDRLGFSEPKVGPLSDFHTYAPDMMELFASGIRQNMDVVRSAVDDMATTIDLGARGGTVINQGGATVTVYARDGQSAREIAQEVADIINGDVQSKGAVWA